MKARLSILESVCSNIGPSIFPTQDPKLHSALRKRVATAYSMSSILKFEQYIQGCLNLCFSKLKEHAEEGQMVDLTDWAAMLTYDIIGELGYGQ
jgi:cytochrome P450